VFDAHVHSAPCVLPRIADDRQTVEWYNRAGFDGCLLKGHVESTVGRAAAACAGTQTRAYGGLVLNHAIGGLNLHAVESALALGARAVWLPTLDAHGHLERGLPRPEALVAEADVMLGTGHLSAPEVGWLVRAARDAGVRRLVVTHATFTVPDLGLAELRELADLGAFIEITAYQLLHQPGCDAARLAGAVRAAGTARAVLSSDAGQPDSPPAPEALQLLVEALGGEGLDRKTLEAMASELPQALVEPS
jgi:cytosine/adenosine deaminase-related metal-dependent hydrolase